jgi:NadR type nicotinamide-nucleotide adenylyltransferase
MTGARRTRRVVVIGPESTGKTALAKELSARFGAPWVPEYAREFVERTGRAVVLEDVDEIGRGQSAGEDRALASRPPLLILDTDLVSTFVYSRHYFGDVPPTVAAAMRSRIADLYLLLAPDVPWVAEADQRQEPERREELFASFRATLEALGASHVAIQGSWSERRRAAIAAVNDCLARPEAGS